MKFNLKKKIFLFSFITNLIIAISIGAALYTYTGDLYYKAFLNSKESLARSIALSIDGEKHKAFTNLEAVRDKEYQKYLKYLNQIRLEEKYVTYLFTINYDREKDRLSYIIDSDINPTDIIWITSEFFGLALSITGDNRISIKYNEVIYTGDFDIEIGGKKIPIKITDSGALYLGDRFLARISSRSPLELETSGRKLNINNRELYSEIYVNNKPVKLYCSFTAKGESQSMPGELYAESKEVIERCKQIINNQKNAVVQREVKTSIYGKNTTTVYGIITDSTGTANGLVVIELFEGEVINFKKAIVTISVIVSLIAFLLSIILTFILAKYIIDPVKELAKGTHKVSKGNLDFTVALNRSDELGILADDFNSMILNLKKARMEITSANKELNNFKNNLELLVEERTRELQKSNNELNKALSEVKDLKGLLPICSSCKKIRDDTGYWNQIESYISRHSRAEFPHSLCPSCAEKLYPEIYGKR
jgi:HAMP domain-containing protein